MDEAAERWEFSLRVDRATRILDVRGPSELFFGQPAAKLAGRHLATYFDEAERLPFLRYMARLIVHGDADAVSATLRTPAIGIKRFFMAARQSDARNSWWLMFSREPKSGAGALDHVGTDQQFATDDEFSALADTHDHAEAPLDITVFRAKALGAGGTSALSSAQREALDQSLGESLIDHAHSGIVARPAIGEYALLHGAGQSTAQMEQRLVAIASQHNLPPEDLGLVRETRSLTQDASTADVIRQMRQNLVARQAAQAIPAAPIGQTVQQRSRLPILLVAGAVALAAVAWVIVHFGA